MYVIIIPTLFGFQIVVCDNGVHQVMVMLVYTEVVKVLIKVRPNL